MTSTFPSPCGVLVLKNENEALKAENALRFRPLAGFWFLKLDLTNIYNVLNRSFRPLAGFWFLNGQGKEI